MRTWSLLGLLLSSCQVPAYLKTVSECPEGYVPVGTGAGEFKGRAMSAEGVVLAVRERPNEQQASLEFWASVVRRELTEAKGYAVRSSKSLGTGRAILFSAPDEKTRLYYLALFVTPARILTCEVAGPQTEVEKDLPRLEDFIDRLAQK